MYSSYAALVPYSFPSTIGMDVKLRLVQFEAGSGQRVGVELGDGGSVVDVTAIDPNIPRDMRSFLRQWDTSLTRAARYAREGAKVWQGRGAGKLHLVVTSQAISLLRVSSVPDYDIILHHISCLHVYSSRSPRAAVAPQSGEHTLRPGSFTLKAPIYDPQKVICVGMNYVDHCTEQNIPVPEEPVIFNKFPSAITEPNGPVIYPEETTVRRGRGGSDLCSGAMSVQCKISVHKEFRL